MTPTQKQIILQLTNQFRGVDGFSARIEPGYKSVYLMLRVKPLGDSWLSLSDDRSMGIRIGMKGSVEVLSDLYLFSKDNPAMKRWTTTQAVRHVCFWAENAKRVSDLIDGGRPFKSPAEWAA